VTKKESYENARMVKLDVIDIEVLIKAISIAETHIISRDMDDANLLETFHLMKNYLRYQCHKDKDPPKEFE
jgi:hypothetical protein